MQIGIFAPTTDYAAPTHLIAKACEERGITYLHRLARERGRDPDGIEIRFFWPSLDRYVELARLVA